jgi:hypothetical protein
VNFVFTGFEQKANFRQYSFEGVAADRTRVAYIVLADLALLRKYQIAVQDAPLLCRRLLEDAGEATITRSFTFTEDNMRKYATDRAAAKEAASLKAKRHRPFPRSNPASQPG